MAPIRLHYLAGSEASPPRALPEERERIWGEAADRLREADCEHNQLWHEAPPAKREPKRAKRKRGEGRDMALKRMSDRAGKLHSRQRLESK